jgi:membrane protease YdiL (CAAX protease family)
MKRLLWACSAVAAYYAALTIATVLRFRVGQAPTDTGAVLVSLLPVQIVLLLLCAVAVRPYGWRAIGFGPLRTAGVIWLLPAIALMVLMLGAVLPHLGATKIRVGTMLLIVAVPLLIGLTEEVMFRGVLLRAAMARLPLFHAMLLSAVLFALMHGIIGIGGQPGLITVQQIAFAFLVGIFLAPIAIATGTLWVVIIWHAVWDMLVYASQIAGIVHHYVLIGIMVQALISVWLWARLIRADQRELS